jgi:uncharacterized membrane protein
MRIREAVESVNDLDVGFKLLGISTIAFAIACFLQRDFAIYWQPVPEDFPFRQPLAFLSASLLALSGAGLFFLQTRRVAAVLQVCLFLAYAVSWLSRPIVVDSIQPWLGIAEHLAIAVGAATIWARLSLAKASSIGLSPESARFAYGCCSLVFALAHVVALENTANLIPAWLPGGPVFWALVTGAGHLAVGLALISGHLAILATRLGSTMYLCFAAIVWLPGAVANPDQWLRWAGLAITLVLLAALWLVGDYLAALRSAGTGEEECSQRGLVSPPGGALAP